MNFVHHKACNGTLTGSEGIESLPVTHGKIQKTEVVRSYWKPSAEELDQLNKMGCIAVTLVGRTHAPIRLDVVATEYSPVHYPKQGGI